jgi:hypothetical protein
MRDIERRPLASTALASAGYDAETQQLEIEFRSGRTYRYRDVPAGVYEFLLRTPRKGSYFARIIEGRYAYEEVTPAAAEQDLLSALSASLNKPASSDD